MLHTISSTLETAFRAAFTLLGIGSEAAVLLVEATRPEFGDYQMNGAMGAAKTLKTNPRELATRIIAAVKLDGIAAKLEIAGPGFINITLDNKYLEQFVSGLNQINRYGVDYLQHQPERVVVDLSSPNLAKEMHVGHLRSTVIGDALARFFEYMGDSVIRQNHVGDWGTQFGMLIAYMRESLSHESANSYTVNDLEKFYQGAKQRFDEDENFAQVARKNVVLLQNGDEEILSLWRRFVHISLSHCQTVYDVLKVNISHADEYGESKYNPQLPLVVEHLTKQNLLQESEGAKCVFFSEGELSGGEETPFIVQKKDGAYLYSTTDLAAMEYRVNKIKFSNNLQGADRIVYVVDARQAFHFKQLFIVGKKAGFAQPQTKLEHSAFGTMMNEDGRPFKTRDGGTVKLIDLINEAKIRAKKIVSDRNPDWSDEEQDKLAEVLAVDSIKYSDLAKNRNSDYIFSFDKMLAFDGNTAPYLLYAYTRVQSILKKASSLNLSTGTLIFGHSAEHRLALQIAKFADNLDIAARECYPHYVCLYLYNLAGLFMQFYEECPILKSEDATLIASRLALADLTAQILKTGLDILGIEVVDRM